MIITYRSDSLLLARLWQSSKKNIGLLALRDEAVGHHTHNIEMLPVICLGGHGQNSELYNEQSESL